MEHWHTRTKTGGISILQRMSPRAWLEMNPIDAENLKLRPHDRVEVISPRGRVSKVELRITEIVAPGQVFLPFHFVESNANQLTQSAFDPISREPNYKQCSVRVERSLLNANPAPDKHIPQFLLEVYMDKKSFMKSGHLPTLFSAFLYFDVSFMVWVLFGPMTPFIADQIHLSATQKGLLTAIPLLGGSFFRPILGLLADRIGGRRAGLTGLTLTLIPLILGWRYASTLWHFYLIGFLLGIAGASFAVALPLAGRWYPAEHQGLAMGIAGAGNSGTLIATFFGPRIAQHYGWHFVFGLALVPIALVLAAFFFLAKNSPSKSAPKPWGKYAQLFTQADTWKLCFLYSLTFGGFVGLASFLSVFFHDQYHLTKVQAGDFTTVVVLAGSFLRPVGGWLADKIGGYRLLLAIFSGVALCL